MFSLSLTGKDGGVETLPLLVKTAGEEKFAAELASAFRRSGTSLTN
jgi:hypothetical protein